MSEAFQMPFVPALDENGDTVPGAQLYFFRAGTTTPEPVYLDVEGENLAPHPVIANSSGRFPPLFSSGNKYKVVLRKASDIILDEIDNFEFTGVSTGSGGGNAAAFEVAVDLEAEKFADTTQVAMFNAPHPAVGSPDPARVGLFQTADEFAYDSAVRPEFYVGTDGDQYASTYRDDIQKYNGLIRAMNRYQDLSEKGNGKVVLKIAKGLHRIWGRENQTGLMSAVSMTGEGVTIQKVSSVSFGPSPRGAEFSQATCVTTAVIHEDVLVGMGFGSGDIISDDTDHSASSATAIVNDHIAYLNGGHIITSIAADRMSFTCDVPHRDGSTTQLVGGDLRNTGAGKTGFAAGNIYIPKTQFAFTGGFDGRRDEAWFRPQYGSNVEYEDLGFIDHTDPLIERENGSPPDRKNFFAANIADVAFRDYCVLVGCAGHVIRLAKMVRFTANRSFFGALGKFTRAGRISYGQINCDMDFTRCASTGGLDYNYLATSFTRMTMQSCVAVNSAFGLDGVTCSFLNYQNSFVFGCGNGFFIGNNSVAIVDQNTVFENCDFEGQIRDTSRYVKLSEPKVINCGPVTDNSTQVTTFNDSIVIDEINGEIEMRHGTANAFIRNLAGQLHFDTDNAARDLHFGVTGTPSLFQMDMSAKQLIIEGVAVIGAPGAAIADATADLASLQTAVNEILARMRDATPTIQT